DSKFKLNALIHRDFCTPYFWTSETFSPALIVERTSRYVYRTLYWLHHSKPQTLADHLEQEIFVCQHGKCSSEQSQELDFRQLAKFYQAHAHQDNYSVLFNFFYGDTASQSLNYPNYGIQSVTGFEYAQKLAEERMKKN
ncbi:MAG: hypothetical protein AAGD05_02680, partial [Bacteroidota bacterium]